MAKTLRKCSGESTYAANSSIGFKLDSYAFDTLTLAVDGSFTSAGATGTPADLAPCPLFDRFTIGQNGSPMITAVELKQLMFLAAIFQTAMPPRVAQTTTSGAFAAEICLPFGAMMPNCGVDATGVDIMVQSSWRTHAAYNDPGANALSAMSAKLNAYVQTVERVPNNGFVKPKIWQIDQDLSVANSALPTKIDIDDALDVPFIILSAEDASSLATATDKYRAVDGLVRNVTVTLKEPNTEPQVICDNVSWQQLRSDTLRYGKLTAADETATAGRVIVPFLEKRQGINLPIRISPKSTITVTIDSVSTCSERYTSVTPASGDKLKIVIVGFTPRPQDAGEGGATELAASSVAARGGFQRRRG